MAKIQINYNPYTVETEIILNGKGIDEASSPLAYVRKKRLQEWMEPKGSWKGFFPTLKNSIGENQVQIEFTGTFGDFEDFVYGKDKFGSCFSKIELEHKNRDTAQNADPYRKMQRLRELYQQLQDGPVEECKTEDIKNNFNAAINSDFRIVIIAPMSSGKSTLINAILGRDLLPAVNQATTAVITEIRDNDQFEDFIVNATDKYGNKVVQNAKATRKLISELNYKKDPKDPEEKEALIHRIQLEGPIPNIPSDMLNTVFVDTPGGNNSQNIEHQAMMDEAINDENKSLILYVFNGAQLGTNDSNIILQKIANAMKSSTNGKQSRDRFLFVANRMDDFDVQKESYEDVIKETILPQLEANGITEPNLFLVSAQTAKLIRKVENGEELSESEEEDLEKLVKRFNRKTRILPQYASLNIESKEKLIAAAERYMKAGEAAENIKEQTKNKYKAAEINSGIPALELAIKEYLEKYAIAIKIKTVHDTFMKKANERRMKDRCEAEWAHSEERFNAVKAELKEKQEKQEHNQKLQEFRGKVETIKLDVTPIKEGQARVIDRMNRLVQGAKEKIKLEEAEYALTRLKNDFGAIGKEAEVALDYALNKGIKASCQEIVEEYVDYIRELDAEGAFNIGGYDMKLTQNFADFRLERVEDLLQDKKYVTNERVKTGQEKVKESGFLSAIARFFGIGGYKMVDRYEDQQFVALKELIRDQVTAIQHEFDKEMNTAIADTENEVERLKELTISKLEDLDKMIEELRNEINQMLINREELERKVEENKYKAQWIAEFVGEVEELLTV